MDPSKKEEYDRLFRLLSSLSTKSKTDEPGSAPPLKQPVISLQNCTSVSRLPPEFLPKPRGMEPLKVPLSTYEIPTNPLVLPESTQETLTPSVEPLPPPALSAEPLPPSALSDTPLPPSALSAEPLPPPALSTEPSVKPLILPAFTYPEFTIISTYQELHEKKKKITYQCEACLKSFAAKDTYDSHTNQSIACQQWKSLSKEEKQIPVEKPIYEFVHEWLQDAMGSSDPFQCRHCNMTFVSRGNHHKHLQVAVACNRLAYLTFMRTIENLNIPRKDHI
jgi:hypothetical protein